MHPLGFTVERARAVGFRFPHRGPGRHVVIRLDAHVATRVDDGSGSGGSVSGVGEFVGESGAWGCVPEVLSGLEGAAVGTGRDDDDVPRLVSKVADLVPGGCPGLLAGVEMALLDLVARAAGVPLAQVLGGRRRPVLVTATAAVDGRHRGMVRDQTGGLGSGRTVKLVGVRGVDEALTAMTTAAGAGGLVWIDLAGALCLADATKLVEAVADRMVAGDLPGHVVVQQPVGDASVADLGEVQAAADALVRPDPSRPGIVILPGIETAEQARELVDCGVRAVELDPHRLGGLLAARELACELTTWRGEVRIGLSAAPGSSGINARAYAELAAALPRVDYLFLPVDQITTHPIETSPPVELDRDGHLPPGPEPGNGVTVSLAPAVHHLTHYAEAPNRPHRPLTHGHLTANTYDVVPSNLLQRAALARGLNTVRFSQFVFVATHPELSQPLGFSHNKTGWTGAPTSNVTRDKELTRTVLRDAGVPVSFGAAFTAGQVDEAVAFAGSIDGPVVVKPRAGTKGMGVSTELRTEADVRRAIAAVAETPYARRGFIVENFVAGNDYRVYVVGDRVRSVVLRQPASVIGDGRSTVVDLVIEKNLVRLENPQMRRGLLIPLGEEAMYWLQRQGLTTESVPEKGRVVRLGSAANISSGGDGVEVLDETHPSLLDLAVRATHAVPGLDHAGIDLIGDHRQGTDAAPAAIIEVNGSPVTILHHFPLFGPPRDVSAELVLRSCELAGFDPGPPRHRINVRLQVDGRVQRVDYRRWLARRARENGLVGSVRNLRSGGVEAHVSGDVDSVSRLSALAFRGPRRAHVERVATSHVDTVEPADHFEVET